MNEEYRQLFENMQDGYYECNLYGEIAFLNKTACDIFGYDRNDLIGLKYRKFMDENTSADF